MSKPPQVESFGAAPHERPVPRISIHAFCEFPDTGAALQRAAGDRRLSKAHLQVARRRCRRPAFAGQSPPTCWWSKPSCMARKLVGARPPGGSHASHDGVVVGQRRGLCRECCAAAPRISGGALSPFTDRSGFGTLSGPRRARSAAWWPWWAPVAAGFFDPGAQYRLVHCRDAYQHHVVDMDCLRHGDLDFNDEASQAFGCASSPERLDDDGLLIKRGEHLR